ncbi:MAG TPA: hypothetical protein VHI31_08975, partial [Actinomycetota bacterium]|nr:hypothetical protein [Actinomycetota bacterium]
GDDYSTPQPLTPPVPPAKKPPALSISRTFRPPPREEKPPADPPAEGRNFEDLQPVKPFDRPDPAFAFDEPPVRAFDPVDVPDPFDSPQPYRPSGSFSAPERSFSPPERSFADPDSALTQAMANPLSRAELVRDYLADSPEEMFLQDPPARPAPKTRRKPLKSEDAPPTKPKSGRPVGRSPKPPANPRTRRKP